MLDYNTPVRNDCSVLSYLLVLFICTLQLIKCIKLQGYKHKDSFIRLMNWIMKQNIWVKNANIVEHNGTLKIACLFHYKTKELIIPDPYKLIMGHPSYRITNLTS